MVQIEVDRDAIAAFCRKWRIVEFSFFGSVLHEDFGPESDVDVLVTFDPDAPWSLWELLEMREELTRRFGRPVDFVEKKALRNPFRRRGILSTYQVIHAAP
jgi:hypothetical protein